MEIGNSCARCCAGRPWHDMGAATQPYSLVACLSAPGCIEARRAVFSGREARITRVHMFSVRTDNTRTSRNSPRQSKMRGGFEEQTRASLSQAGGLPWLWVCQPANRCPSPTPDAYRKHPNMIPARGIRIVLGSGGFRNSLGDRREPPRLRPGDLPTCPNQRARSLLPRPWQDHEGEAAGDAIGRHASVPVRIQGCRHEKHLARSAACLVAQIHAQTSAAQGLGIGCVTTGACHWISTHQSPSRRSPRSRVQQHQRRPMSPFM